MQMVRPAAKRCTQSQSSHTTMLNRLREKKKLLKNISRAGEAGSSRKYYQTEAQTGMILIAFPLPVGIYSQSQLYILGMDRAKPEE